MIYIFLADGFEEIEALGTMDILRRCGLEVQLLSVNGKRVVNGAHGLEVKADRRWRSHKCGYQNHRGITAPEM